MDHGALPEYLDSLSRRERAARHAVVVPLLVHTLALAVVLALDVLFLVRLANETRTDWTMAGWEVIAYDPRTLLPLLPLVVYVVVWVVSRVRARLTGIGAGHDGWGVMAIVAGGLLVTFPLGSVVLQFLGTAFVLGVGLTVLGARLRDVLLWVPGLVLMVVGPLANLGTFENHAQFLGPWPTQVVLGILTLGLVATTAVAWRREHTALHAAPLLVTT
jgi:hypothetical protein